MRSKIAFVYLLSTPLDNITGRFKGQDLVIQEIVMPLGLMYLSSYVKKNNDAEVVGIIDYVINERDILQFKSPEHYIEEIAKRSVSAPPDVLAFSLNLSTSHHFFLMCVDILKKIWPNTTIVAGGVHASNYTRQLLATGKIDYLFRGEGEFAFSKFLDQFGKAKTIEVKGVYTRENIGSAKVLALCDHVDELDSIPFPDWELTDIDKYVTGITRFPKKHGDSPKRMAEIFTSRGCPYRCTFCSSHTVHGRSVRFRSIENIAAEVKELNTKYGVTTFFPEDDAFTINKKRTLDMLSAVRGLGVPGFEMQFPNGLSVASTDEEVIDALIAAGMQMATFAIESGSPYVQKNIINKSCDLEKAKRLVSYTRSKGIRVRCYFILGFPGETKELMKETEGYIRTLAADWYDFFVATPLVGSDMYNDFFELGYITDDPMVWKSGFFWRRNFDTPEISAAELNDYVYRLNLKYNFLQNINVVNGNYQEAIDIYSGVLKKYPYHMVGWYCVAECYRLMGKGEQSRETAERMKGLVASDGRAKDMFDQYHDLMPNFKL